jgi:hypothetical protein
MCLYAIASCAFTSAALDFVLRKREPKMTSLTTKGRTRAQVSISAMQRFRHYKENEWFPLIAYRGGGMSGRRCSEMEAITAAISPAVYEPLTMPLMDG